VSRLKRSEEGRRSDQILVSCRSKFAAIQRRILGFLITGLWLREAAKERGIVVTMRQVHREYETEVAHYNSTPGALHRLKQASRQSASDLEFAVETQMLSGKLLQAFTKAHPYLRGEQGTIAAFNTSIRNTWIPRTICEPGYVVPDCMEYKP
jgi:hypothetical protein